MTYQRGSGSNPRRNAETQLSARRRFGVIALAVLAVLFCSGASSPTGCQTNSQPIGPSEGEVVGAAVGIVAVVATVVIVAVEVNHSHHTLRGCVAAGPNGLELRTSDAKTYVLEGDAAGIKVGDTVKLHGSKIKKTRNSTGDQVFKVQSMKKDFGPCPATSTPPGTPAQ
jgi:hypothetical protein